jgi:hypothetical protein
MQKLEDALWDMDIDEYVFVLARYDEGGQRQRKLSIYKRVNCESKACRERLFLKTDRQPPTNVVVLQKEFEAGTMTEMGVLSHPTILAEVKRLTADWWNVYIACMSFDGKVLQRLFTVVDGVPTRCKIIDMQLQPYNT